MEAFQSSRGLGADGIVGPQTWPELVIQVQPGSNGDAVRAVQSQIHGRGDGVHIAVDGIFGPQTKRMITAFEANRRSAGLLLISDGVVESSSKDGFTGRGVLFKIIHLNRSAKNADEFRYADLPFNPETNAILRGALQPGAVRPPRPRQPGT